MLCRAKITSKLLCLCKVLGLLMLLGLLFACAAQSKVDKVATKHAFERSVIQSNTFRHLIYSHNVTNTPHKILHIYLEGDGNPWLRPNIISVDPTGRNPFALNLMALDKRPSLYIGRPCYHGFYQDENCGPALWTHARYSPQVVDSMAVVLEKIIIRYRSSDIYLIGYSGGGVLAMLLAERIKQIKKVITIAANLDVAAWTEQHQYSPLHLSLNPAKRLPLYKNIPQHHFAGRQDDNVPWQIISSFVAEQNRPQITLSIIEQFDHKCCWLDRWSSLVKKIDIK